MFAATLSAALVGTMVPVATGMLIDHAIPDADRSLLLQLAGALAAAAFGKLLFDVARGFATIRLQTVSSHVTQAAVWDRLLALRPSFFRQFTTGELSNRSLVVSLVHRRLSGATLQSVVTGAAALLNFVLMAAYGGSLALLAVAAAAVAVSVVVLGGLRMVEVLTRLRAIEGQIFGLTVQLVQGVSKLRVTGAENAAFARWADRYETQQRLALGVQRTQDRISVVQRTLPVLNSAVLFWLAYESIQAANAGEGLSTGAFLAFNSAFGSFLAGTTDLGATAVQVMRDLSLFKTARPILEAEREVDRRSTSPGCLIGRLSLDHISFRYRPQGALTLDGVSIEAQPGQFIALVGPSGSGKSTILRIVLGFERPETGTVLLDGQDLAGLDVSAVRRQLGVVMQASHILPGTVFENIAAGGMLTLTEAAAAARDAGLEDDLASWPMGLHTYISEGGTSLSGGQRQRLLIARALAHRPRILLFDEATSALDNRTQEIVSQSLQSLRVTRIVIAHRLTTIQKADRIYVIDQGRVVQQGSFEALSREEGLFRRMMARQML
ncbi:MAG: NHLP bacteriocin export ABC transporter permease/ATPase subunit [Acidobacteria bacterium]|nr:NHLP bacteriocin export ABC transporter permease/ATPase subunit [Acidobacteriota bacterium]